ncbi:MAG TPA: hypothetical protein VH253_04330 [Phycisphaerae bacterium]|nr:hypothetical protein [Phycisphaerae bacterium]
MAHLNIRSARRHRHEGKQRGGAQARSAGGRQLEYATAGAESGERGRDPKTDPKTLSDFDPNYGHTTGTNEQAKGGAETVVRESYGRGGEPSATPQSPVIEGGSPGGEHPTGYGEQYGQGFGVGAGHGVQSDSSGLGGSPRERDYRGNAGMTYGATVGPDALKEDTSQDKRPDDKPAA